MSKPRLSLIFRIGAAFFAICFLLGLVLYWQKLKRSEPWSFFHGKSKLTAEFVYAHHYPVDDIVQFVIDYRAREISSMLPRGYDFLINLLPLNEKTRRGNVDWSDCNFRPRITFFFKEDQGQKFLVDFLANPAFLYGCRRGQLIAPEDQEFCHEEDVKAEMEDIVVKIWELKKALDSNHASPSWVTSFSELELQALHNNSWAILSVNWFLASIADRAGYRSVVEEKVIESSKIMGSPIAGFLDFFFVKHRLYTTFFYYQKRVLIVAWALAFLLLLFYSFRQNGISLLEAELMRQGVVLSQEQWLKTLKTNRKLFLPVFSRKKVFAQVKTLAGYHKEDWLLKEISRQAEEVWAGLNDLGLEDEELRGLRFHYELAVGLKEGKSSTTRQEHLDVLKRRLGRGCQKEAPAVNGATACVTPKRIKREVSPSERYLLLKEISAKLSAENPQVNLTTLSSSELRNLEYLLRALPEVVADGLDLFFKLPNWRSRLRNDSTFVTALKMEDWDIVKEDLGVPRPLQGAKTGVSSPSLDLSGKRVVLVGCKIIEANSGLFCERVLEIGAKECSYRRVHGPNDFKLLARTDRVDVYLVFSRDIPFLTTQLSNYLVREGSATVVMMLTTNISRFAEELRSKL